METNTSKKQEIQAMAKVLYGRYCGSDECGKCKQPNCADYHRAETLHNEGFRMAEEVRKETAKEIFTTIIFLMESKKIYGRAIDIDEFTEFLRGFAANSGVEEL